MKTIACACHPVYRLLPLLVAVAAVASLGSGCGDNENIVGTKAAVMAVNPDQITFSLVAIGETDSRPLTIRSEGEGDLVISSFDVRGGVFSSSFIEDELPLRLAPGESVNLDVYFTPDSRDNVQGSIVINSNDAHDSERGGERRIPLATQALQPIISVFPSIIDFGRVPGGSVVTQTATIQNTGSADLVIGNVQPVGSQDFRMTTAVGDAIGEAHPLPPGGAIDVEIEYSPTSDGFDQGELLITSNDPINDRLLVPIRANGAEPCIAVTHEEGYDFGGRMVGQVAEEVFTITNCSDAVNGETLLVSGISLIAERTASSFGLDNLPAIPTEIPPGGVADFTVTFAPTEEIAEVGVLEILSNDAFKSTLEIEIRGLGSSNMCPTAVAKCRIQGVAGPFVSEIAAAPLQTVECTGLDSTDSDGSIVQYIWSVVDRPEGSTATFTPPNVASPTFFLDLAGRYEFELSVVDNGGLMSCNTPPRVTVVATPGEDIHIQLVWNTPADANETDTGVGRGSDVDLHFLHPSGGWENRTWDCHFRARTPNWGILGRSDDDPSLDIDDTDGAGPENINISNPEDGVTYRVGVHYWDDHGFGTSFATVRIYVFGVQQFEARERELTTTGQFWDVAAISWPSASITRIDRVTTDFP